ncbi:uncharacterized protein LOC126888116 [Diabrotica virgifera virgifera]|uniref:Uncharacterized protein n=1 Tax=Diabrotica virgifera virgifera TaxID=50390 RepID=A0ABM5KPI3_DIAVI|nr:uncharacterized protein LOC126888116 [Diabrotica virgifera virgifera]
MIIYLLEKKLLRLKLLVTLIQIQRRVIKDVERRKLYPLLLNLMKMMNLRNMHQIGKQFKVTKMPTPPIWTNDMAEIVDELTVSNTPSQTGNSSTPCFTPGQVHHDRNMGPGSKSNYTTPKRALKEIHENLNNVDFIFFQTWW